MHKQLTMKGPQQVQLEYGYLLKPTGPQKTELIGQWINEWEDRATQLSTVSPVHSFPDELRRNIFVESMPKGVQDQIETERMKGNQLTHMALRSWLISLGTQAMLNTAKGTAPLLFHNVNEKPSEPVSDTQTRSGISS